MIENVPGIRLSQAYGMDGERGFVAFGANGCLATVYVNGVRLNLLTQKRAADEMRSVIFDGITEVGSLAGIEVYSHGARTPPAYAALNGSCSVVLIWTK